MRTLAHISDLHFGALDEPVARALVPYLNTLAPDVLIVSGDLTQRARPLQFTEAMDYLGELPGTRLIVPGNHDIPLYAVLERFVLPLRRYQRYATDNLAPVYEDEDLFILGVSTPRPFVPVHDGFWKDGRVSPRQLRPLQQSQPRAAGEDKLRLVVTHHPFVPAPGTRRGGTVLHGERVLHLLATSGIDVLLAGHLHASYHAPIRVTWGEEKTRVRRDLLSIQAGTATSSRRRHHPDGREYPNAFNFLRFSRQAEHGGEQDLLELEVHAWRGEGTPGGWGRESRVVFGRFSWGFQAV